MHLSNVLYNLLNNAVKYSSEAPVIAVRTEDGENGIRIMVSDRGMGMTTEVQKKVFDKFYRAHTDNLHDVKGYGLGLSYVKEMAAAHGGWVKVESEWKKGSTFELFLPVEPNIISHDKA